MSYVVWEKFPFRIREIADEDFDIESLKGDLFKWKHAASMGFTGTREDMEREEREFMAEAYSEGVYGYTLEICNLTKRDSDGEHVWEHVDSCWGFVGQYVSTKKHKYNHYIVAEMIGTARNLRKGKAS